MRILFTRYGDVVETDEDVQTRYNGWSLIVPCYGHEVSFTVTEDDEYGIHLGIHLYRGDLIALMYHNSREFPFAITAKHLEIKANMVIWDGDVMFDVEIRRKEQP